jgi:hypothetical protein
VDEEEIYGMRERWGERERERKVCKEWERVIEKGRKGEMEKEREREREGNAKFECEVF